MNLLDLTPSPSSQRVGKLVNSYFKNDINFSALSESAATRMLKKVNKTITEYKSTLKRHKSEKDANYLQLMLMKEGLTKRIAEETPVDPNDPVVKATAKAVTGQTVTGDEAQKLAATVELNTDSTDPVDPEKDQILKKAKQGQTVSGQDAKELGSMLATTEADESGQFGVFLQGGSVGEKRSSKPAKTFDTKEEARAYAKRMNKQLSPGEKQHYKLKYSVKAMPALAEEDTTDKKPGASDRIKQRVKSRKRAPKQVVAKKQESSPAKSNTSYTVGGGVYENFSTMYNKFLAEGADVDQAQVVLAAQDMVDSVQDMLEKISKIKVEELYPLNDAITATLGSDKAQSFTSTADNTLQSVLDALQSARQDMSSAVAALTGDDVPADFAAQIGDEQEDGSDDTGLDMSDDDDMGDLDLGLDDNEQDLGRQRR